MIQMTPPKNHHGFTIVEVSMIVAIIGVLAAILLPSLGRAREAGRRALCMSNLSQLGMALRIYADESGGQLPWSGGKNDARCLTAFCRDGLLDYELFVCPSDASFSAQEFNDPEAPFDFAKNEHALNTFGLRASYDYFGAYTAAPIALPPPTRGTPKIPLVWDAGATIEQELNHAPGGSNVLWLDGSVTFIRYEEFAGINLPYAPEALDYVDPGEGMRPFDDPATPHPGRGPGSLTMQDGVS